MRRSLSAVAGLVVLAGCQDDPGLSPVPAPLRPPEQAVEGQSPLIELTISGIGTASPTTSAVMIPGWAPARPVRGGASLARAAQRAREIRREILRTPSGEILDFAPDGAWRVWARGVAAHRQALLSRGDFRALNAPSAAPSVSASAAAVSGVRRVPAVLYRFSDVGTAPSLGAGAGDTSKYNQLIFSATAPTGMGYSTPYSIRSFYAQMSNGMLDLQGEVVGWYTLASAETNYTGGQNCAGLNPYGYTNCNGIWSTTASTAMRGGLTEALTQADATTDFGLYDNDGPDGDADSGDDDGFVDMAIFVHSELDGACVSASNQHLWSHRSRMPFNGGNYFVTDDPRSGGGFIQVRDYTLQSGVGGSGGCTSTLIMSIGTAAHETGHAFGLPDLYDTQQGSEGIGNWGLMGSGNQSSGASPARMEAWSLNELGWITLRPLTIDGTYTLGPVPTSDSAFVLRVQGTNARKEYYFLENRQAVHSDTAVVRVACTRSGLSYPSTCRGGLAIWHADSTKLQAGKSTNSVNTGTIHGLSLVQPDGNGDLEVSFNRGDAGDLWPGFGLGTPKTLYGISSTPAALTNEDGARFVGFRVDQVLQTVQNGEMSLRVTFGRPLTPMATTPPLDGTIQLDRLSASSLQIGPRPGGYNYVSATYRVRNASLAGNTYGTARTNLTFLGVATPTTLNQSAVTQFLRFDGSPASLSAATMEPTGAVVDNGSGGVTASVPDVLQAYTEADLVSFSPIPGVTSILPYGFVVRNPSRANDRMLPASPAVGTYDGVVTFAFRLPLQASAPDDPYTIVAKFLAVDDDQVGVTQSPQETDAPSVSAIVTRVTNLGAAVRSLVGTSVGAKTAEKVCIRTAGPAGAATHIVGNCPP